jgi:hypothetical protein
LALQENTRISWSKMNVRLAAQVLSNRVSSGLRVFSQYIVSKEGHPLNVTATAEYCLQCNDLFDSFNSDKKLVAIKFHTEWKQNLLKQEGWFLQWRDDIQLLDHLTTGEKEKSLIAAKTLYDLQLAVHGFIGVCTDFFELYPEGFLVPRRLNQDALENFFGQVGLASTLHSFIGCLKFPFYHVPMYVHVGLPFSMC